MPAAQPNKRSSRATLHGVRALCAARCIVHLRLQCCRLYIANCMLLSRDRALRSSAVAGAATEACIHIGHSGSAAPRPPSLRDGRRRTTAVSRFVRTQSTAQRSAAQHGMVWLGLAWRRAARVDLVACGGRGLTFDLISSSSPSLMYLRSGALCGVAQALVEPPCTSECPRSVSHISRLERVRVARDARRGAARTA